MISTGFNSVYVVYKNKNKYIHYGLVHYCILSDTEEVCIAAANALSAPEVKIPSSWYQLLKPFQQSKISGDLIDRHLFITGTVGMLPVAAEHRRERLDESQRLWGGKGCEKPFKEGRGHLFLSPATVNFYLYKCIC